MASKNVQEAKGWLEAAIQRHQRHMDKTEATSMQSQEQMMKEMKNALAWLKRE